MRVAILTLKEQSRIEDLLEERKRYRNAGTELGDLMRTLAQKHFSIPLRPFYHDKINIDQTGKYIILE